MSEIASSPGVCRSGSGTCGEQSGQVSSCTTSRCRESVCKVDYRLHVQAGYCTAACIKHVLFMLYDD